MHKEHKNSVEAVNKVVGTVTPEERDEIMRLYERKNSLKELFSSLMCMPREEVEGNFLYEKLVNDITKTTSEFTAWWDNKSVKYKWKNMHGHSWQIDFKTCEIFLKTNTHNCQPMREMPPPK